MATFEFVLPELGEGIETGDIVQVRVAVGDTVVQEQTIVFELETDKAVVEVPSPENGTVTAIYVHPGDTVKVGQRLLTLEMAQAAVAVSPGVPAAPPAERQPPVVLPMERPEPSVPSPVLPAGNLLPQQPVPAPPSRIAAASPSVRRLAREIGVDIHAVPGSGAAGRVSVEDVKSYARRLNTSQDGVPPTSAPWPTVSLPEVTKWGAAERRAMSNVRRRTAEHLAQAWASIPHVTQFDRADITDLEQLRQQFAKKAEAAGGKLTITAIIMKVLATALKKFPQFNASVDMKNHEVVYKQYYHIGVAVDTDRGLLVPVIRHVDQKNILALSVELTELAERARTRKTTLEEMQGGTFTVTNLGGIGGSYFSPIINAPEVAILGVARSSMEPVYSQGQFVPRLLLPLALSYDHRLIDGADGARFLRWVVEALQQPFLLALEG